MVCNYSVGRPILSDTCTVLVRDLLQTDDQLALYEYVIHAEYLQPLYLSTSQA